MRNSKTLLSAAGVSGGVAAAHRLAAYALAPLLSGHGWLVAWPALALACGLPLGPAGQPRVPRAAHQSKRQKLRDGLPPTWTADELGKRISIEQFFGRVLVFFRLQRPPVLGWSAVETRVALTYAAAWVIALAAWQVRRPELIRSPRLVLAHVWEGMEM
jgi:hypothetical protein